MAATTLRRRPIHFHPYGPRAMWAIARGVLLEAARRKDYYALLIVGAALVAVAALISRFGGAEAHRFLKDVMLFAVNWLSAIFAVLLAARQIPQERANGTICPVLARPVSRAQFLLGKWLGAFIASAAGLAVFVLLAEVVFWLNGAPAGFILGQHFVVKCLLLGMLCAVAVVLPLFATHGAAVAGVFVLLLGSPVVLRAIEQARAGAEGFAQSVWAAAYFLTPQFELFDLSKKVVHEWAAIPGWAFGWLIAYAAAFSAAWLYLGTWRIARMRL